MACPDDAPVVAVAASIDRRLNPQPARRRVAGTEQRRAVARIGTAAHKTHRDDNEPAGTATDMTPAGATLSLGCRCIQCDSSTKEQPESDEPGP